MGIECKSDKVVMIGAGLVGSTSAYAIMDAGTVSEIVLIDMDSKRLAGEVMDLTHGAAFVPQVTVRTGTYSDCADAGVVVITAGAGQKPGESRLDLLKKNVEVFRDVVPRVASAVTDAVLVVVTNPVDILTYVALKISGLPANRVIGSGTLLDSARFRFLLSRHCEVAAQNVHAYIIGEHGDSEVPAWSATNVAGMPFEEFCVGCGLVGCTPGRKDAIFDNVKNAAYRIIEDKGATYYAVGLAVRRIVQAIVRDERAVLEVSSLMQGQHGVEDVCLSLPTVVNSGGVARVLEIDLSDSERAGFRASAEELKKTIAGLST